MRAIRVFAATVIGILSYSATGVAQDTTSYAELPRFKQVTERLYRGAQPRDGGIRRLHELGIDTIVNLRGASDQTRAEGAEARALGLNYFNIALPNWARPQDARVHRILLIMAAPQNGRVFVHCKDGVDRTGTIVALHRITHQHWNTRDALAEAEDLGMRRIQFWMRDYAQDYGRHADTIYYHGTDANLGDRIGASMRIVEIGTFRVSKVGSRVLRSASRKISGFLANVF
jgi:protein tyrosine/serine phosphatase